MRETCERHVSRHCHWPTICTRYLLPIHTGESRLVARGSALNSFSRKGILYFSYYSNISENRIKYVSGGKRRRLSRGKGEREKLSLSRNYLFFPERRRFLENVQKQIEFRESWKRARFSDTKILDSLPLIYHPIFECGAFQSRLKFTQQPAAALDLIQWRGRSRVDGNRDKQLPLTTTPRIFFSFGPFPPSHVGFLNLSSSPPSALETHKFYWVGN